MKKIKIIFILVLISQGGKMDKCFYHRKVIIYDFGILFNNLTKSIRWNIINLDKSYCKGFSRQGNLFMILTFDMFTGAVPAPKLLKTIEYSTF